MKKIGKSGRKWKIIITAVVLLLLTAGVFSVRVQSVTVTGNQYYTDEQVIDMLFQDQWSRLSAVSYFRALLEKHEKIPFVEEYKITFRSPVRVEVILYEKSLVGYVNYMSSYMYFDKDGIIVESANEELDKIPMISGLKFGHIVLHERLPVGDPRIFDGILNLTQILASYEISVDKIQYDSGRRATLYIGEVEVELGGPDHMDGKISVLNDIIKGIPEFGSLAGILYLDTYDETNANSAYYLQQKDNGPNGYEH